MAKKSKIDKFHIHEVLDRTHIIMENISSNILEHKVVIQDKKLKKQFEKSLQELYKAYDLISKKHLDE